MIAKLIVTSGKNAGRAIAIKRDRLLIGRSEECDVRPLSEEVSRRHCAVLVGPTDVWVEDQGSRNGTFVNGQRIEAKTRVRDGDLIRVGSLELKVSCSDPAARAGSDNDVSKWLMTDEESPAAGTRASKSRGVDTTQLMPAADGAAGRLTARETSDLDATLADTTSDKTADTNGHSSTTHAVADGPDSRSRPGLLPREGKKKADSSRDAAAEALKKFFENR
jgi:pSer/pThr/pTyr-binding forkhead associated (FHA) protein